MSVATTSPDGKVAARRGIEYKWQAGFVVVVGAIMVILDQTVVNVALPTLEVDFGVSLGQVQWIVTAYALALAAVIPLAGWMSDRYGTKRVFVISQLLFTMGSVLCGLAWSNDVLIGFRVLQGLGGALIMPVGMAILMGATRPEERGRMMAVLGAPMMVGPVLGPTLGGWLVQTASWRLIFYINLPIGIAGALLSMLILREARQERLRQPLDVVGLALIVPAMLGVVYGLGQPNTYGWGSVQTLLPLVGGLVLLLAFCLFELRQRFPLIDIRVFQDAAFRASMVLAFLVPMALFGGVFLMPLFLQQVQGYGPLDSGLILAAQGLAAAAMSPLSGYLTDRFGARWVVPVGLSLLGAATVWMTTLSPGTPARTITLMMALRGAGMGFAMIPAMSAAYVTLAPSMISRATSVTNVIQRVASGLGVTAMATILGNRIAANLPALPHGASSATGGGKLPAGIRSLVLAQVAKGFDDTFWISLGFVLLAFPMALTLRRALKPQVVRSYAVQQLAEGVVLGAAARYLRDGRARTLSLPPGGPPSGRIDTASAFKVLAEAATGRLQKGLTLIQAGTSASGLVPQPGLSRSLRAAFAVVLVLALVGIVLAVAHGYEPPQVPALPHPRGLSASG
jgi:EmrB/QacA subfamily drug resistance transporter